MTRTLPLALFAAAMLFTPAMTFAAENSPSYALKKQGRVAFQKQNHQDMDMGADMNMSDKTADTMQMIAPAAGMENPMKSDNDPHVERPSTDGKWIGFPYNKY
ncbi:MAG: hypothetical protein H6863_03555 [Rhodospirillales bacterium]|nr:hypothetical protein [Rhodospirillales bacterium]